MYGGELKVMAVGGPNVRSDYHLEAGEELFFQLQGDMVLKIIERNQPKDVLIREGEIFLLPPRIPHSPQRRANTIGLVVERERRETEMDGMRWFVEGTADVLYEEYFHCTDLVIQLPPVIRRFQASPMYQTGKPSSDGQGIVREPPIHVDTETETVPPKNVEAWIREHSQVLGSGGSAVICDGKDFKVTIIGHNASLENVVHNSETYYYQMKGEGVLKTEKEEIRLRPSSMVLVRPHVKHEIKFGEDSICMQLYWHSI